MTHSACLLGVASAFPEHRIDRAQTLTALTRLFPGEEPQFLAEIVERSGVHERALALPLEDTLAARDFTARNREYAQLALQLAERAARGALEQAGVLAREVTTLIDVSCTGLVIPALDAALVEQLELSPCVRRLPIAQSGCAAGAVGLALAGTLARAGETVLVVAAELCSLTLIPGDHSRTNLIASAIFGDGAAAALVAPRPGALAFRASSARLLPDTRELMGFDVGTHGLRIVLARELPSRLAAALGPAIAEFLARAELDVRDLELHLVHPGGRRILESYAELFGLQKSDLRHSWASLAEHGNLSSASLLTVFETALAEWTVGGQVRGTTRKAALGVGVGPGLGLELSLWEFDTSA